MKILHRERIGKFSTKHVDAVRPLQRWVDKVEEAAWRNHADLKLDFPSADYVGNGRYVFNIKGNSYRMVVVATFVAGLLSIQFIGTHEEYDRIDCSII
ncbi:MULTISPECIES: type II toxin-antitoxin system HigB family toxin [Parabacteroides]|uniref:type II toxin-antitoxin system HigB family toxin n=1 Tax=Parabacteroides leei TaxID=2939491 RepID=UPI00189A2180|nr:MULTISPECIES: type II toxin-antitoxin system HigB family toxin [Parabacteroides]MCL3852527.1 type II toxin-antitoxin system HigB family toxin [Parabacteroides leei]